MIGAIFQDKEWTEVTHPELPSQESAFVRPSFTEEETQSSSFNTQVPVNTHTHIVTVRNNSNYTLLDSINLAFLCKNVNNLLAFSRW